MVSDKTKRNPSSMPLLYHSLYLKIKVLFGKIFSNVDDPIMANVSTAGSSLDDRELIALAGNDTVTSPVTLCLKRLIFIELLSFRVQIRKNRLE